MKNYRFSNAIEKNRGGYFDFCPELQGCYAQGDTYEEVLENIKDAIRLHGEDRIESGEKILQLESFSYMSEKLPRVTAKKWKGR